jgi:hypothetical protein
LLNIVHGLEAARLGEMSEISIRHGQNTVAYSKGLKRAGFCRAPK